MPSSLQITAHSPQTQTYASDTLKTVKEQLFSKLQAQYERLWQESALAPASRELGDETRGVMRPTSVSCASLGFPKSDNGRHWLQRDTAAMDCGAWTSRGAVYPLEKYTRPYSAFQHSQPWRAEPCDALGSWGQRWVVPSQPDLPLPGPSYNIFSAPTQSCHHLRCTQQQQLPTNAVQNEGTANHRKFFTTSERCSSGSGRWSGGWDIENGEQWAKAKDVEGVKFPPPPHSAWLVDGGSAVRRPSPLPRESALSAPLSDSPHNSPQGSSPRDDHEDITTRETPLDLSASAELTVTTKTSSSESVSSRSPSALSRHGSLSATADISSNSILSGAVREVANATSQLTGECLPVNMDHHHSPDSSLKNMMHLLSDTISELGVSPVRLATQVLQSSDDARRAISSERFSLTSSEDKKGTVREETSSGGTSSNESAVTKISQLPKRNDDPSGNNSTDVDSTNYKMKNDKKLSIPKELASLEHKLLSLVKSSQIRKTNSIDNSKENEITTHEPYQHEILDKINELKANIVQIKTSKNTEISSTKKTYVSLEKDTLHSEKKSKIKDQFFFEENKTFGKIDAPKNKVNINVNENENNLLTSSFKDANMTEEINSINITETRDEEGKNAPNIFSKESNSLNDEEKILKRGKISYIMNENNISESGTESNTNTPKQTAQETLKKYDKVVDTFIAENNKAPCAENNSNAPNKDKIREDKTMKIEEKYSSITQSVTKEKCQEKEERVAKNEEISVTREDNQHQNETEDKKSQDVEEISNVNTNPHAVSASAARVFRRKALDAVRTKGTPSKKLKLARSPSVGFRVPRKRARRRSSDANGPFPIVQHSPQATTHQHPSTTRRQRSPAATSESSLSSSARTVMAASTTDGRSRKSHSSRSVFSIDAKTNLQNIESNKTSLLTVASEELNAQGDHVVEQLKHPASHKNLITDSFQGSLAERGNVKHKISKTKLKSNLFHKVLSSKDTSLATSCSSYNKSTVKSKSMLSGNTFSRTASSLASKKQNHQIGKTIRSIEIEFSDNTKLEIFSTDTSATSFEEFSSPRRAKHDSIYNQSERLVCSDKILINECRRVGTPEEDASNVGDSFILKMTTPKTSKKCSRELSRRAQRRSANMTTDISESGWESVSDSALLAESIRERGIEGKCWQNERKSVEKNNYFKTEYVGSSVRQNTEVLRSIFDRNLERGGNISEVSKSLTLHQSSDCKENKIVMESGTSSGFSTVSEINFTNKRSVSSQISSDILSRGNMHSEYKCDKGIQTSADQEIDIQCGSSGNDGEVQKNDSYQNTAELLMTSLSNQSYHKTYRNQSTKIETNTQLQENAIEVISPFIAQSSAEFKEMNNAVITNALLKISTTSNNQSVLPNAKITNIDTLNIFSNAHSIRNCLLNTNVEIEASDSYQKGLWNLGKVAKALVHKTFSLDLKQTYDFKKVQFPLRSVQSGSVLQMKNLKSTKSPLNLTFKPALLSHVFFGDNNNKYFWDRCDRRLGWNQAFDQYRTFQTLSKEMNEVSKMNKYNERKTNSGLLKSKINCILKNTEVPIVRSAERKVSLNFNSSPSRTNNAKKSNQTANGGKRTLSSPQLTLSLRLVLENSNDKKNTTLIPKIEMLNNSGQQTANIRYAGTSVNSVPEYIYPLSFTENIRRNIFVQEPLKKSGVTLNNVKSNIAIRKYDKNKLSRSTNKATKATTPRTSGHNRFENSVGSPNIKYPLRSILKNPLQPSMNSTNSKDNTVFEGLKPRSCFVSNKQEKTIDSLNEERTITSKSEKKKFNRKQSPSLNVTFKKPVKGKIKLSMPLLTSPVHRYLENIGNDSGSSNIESKIVKEETENKKSSSSSNNQSEDESDFLSAGSDSLNQKEVSESKFDNKTNDGNYVQYFTKEQKTKELSQNNESPVHSSKDIKNKTHCSLHTESHSYPIRAVKGVPNLMVSNMILETESPGKNNGSHKCNRDSEKRDKRYEEQIVEDYKEDMNWNQKTSETLKIKHTMSTEDMALETNHNIQEDQKSSQKQDKEQVRSASDEIKMEGNKIESKIENISEKDKGGGEAEAEEEGCRGARKRAWGRCRGGGGRLRSLAAALERLARAYRPSDAECATEDEVTWDSSGCGVELRPPPPHPSPALEGLAAALKAQLEQLQQNDQNSSSKKADV